MPVFDFNNTPEPDVVPECTYTTFASDENVSSADKPLLVLDNSKKPGNITPAERLPIRTSVPLLNLKKMMVLL